MFFISWNLRDSGIPEQVCSEPVVSHAAGGPTETCISQGHQVSQADIVNSSENTAQVFKSVFKNLSLPHSGNVKVQEL